MGKVPHVTSPGLDCSNLDAWTFCSSKTSFKGGGSAAMKKITMLPPKWLFFILGGEKRLPLFSPHLATSWEASPGHLTQHGFLPRELQQPSLLGLMLVLRSGSSAAQVLYRPQMMVGGNCPMCKSITPFKGLGPQLWGRGGFRVTSPQYVTSRL